MIGRMQSPWQTDLSPEDYLGERNDNGWSSNAIERSTSAPPVSVSTEARLSFMNVGNDNSGGRGGGEHFLFDNTQTNYAGDQGSSLFRPSGRDSAPPSNTTSSSSSFLAGLRDSSGRSTAPITAGYGGGGLSEALLHNSGMTGTNAGMYRSGSVGTDFSGMGYDDNRRIDEQMVRSRSAAPSMLGRTSLMPPPGLGMSSHNGEATSSLFGNAPTPNNIMEIGQRRAASTGILGEYDSDAYSVLSSLGREFDHGGSGAVRPAPKTLMDLIQEDIPNDHSVSRPHTAAPYPEREAVMYSERENTSYGYQRNTHRSRSASPPYQSNIMDVVPQGYHQVQRRDMDPYQPHDDNMGGLSHQMETLHVGRGHHQQPYDQPQQRQYQHREPSRGPQYMTVPSSQGQRGDQQIRLQGRDSQMQEQPQQRSIYAPARVHGAPQNHHHQQQLSHQAYDAQPQVYYSSGQHGGPSPQMTQQPQVQILPSGQAVYVQAPPQYNYANVQYLPQQHHLQQTPLGHHQHQQVTSDPHRQYISVMPVQGGGGQVAYWQHQEMQVGGGGGMAPAPMIMNPRGGHPPVVPMGHTSAPAIDRSPSHGGRAKGNVGTRSPSNTGGKVRGGGRGGGRGRNDTHAKNTASGTPVASVLLEEFRGTKNRDWTILDIKGHVVEFCQDQNGSRFIQQRLEIGNPNEQQVVMAEVLPAVRQLRNDVFGNYVVQKLLEFGTPEMKIGLRDTLQGEMLPLSMQMYGCRVVQKAFEALSEEDLPQLLMEFHQSVLTCIHDQNGNHVIQKCIEVLSTKAKQALAAKDWARAEFFGEQIDFVIDDVLNNVVSLSCHPYGCRVLQRILEHCVEGKKNRALDVIAECHKVLLDDQYGNYVIQHVLQYGRNSDRQSVLGIVVANGLLTLSKQKFASNVVEKLLKYGTPSQRNALVREMLKRVNDSSGSVDTSSSVVLLMVRDAYANYVVQTTLDVVAEGEEKRLLIEELNAHSTQLRNYTFAKHIVTKLSS